MADVVYENHDNLTIINRFGIPLGFGDQSVSEVCQTFGINISLFLSICNNDIDVKATNDNRSLLIRQLLMFLRNSHNYYRTLFLPEIKSKLHRLSEQYHSNIQSALNIFFDQYENEVLSHLQVEEQDLFPHIEQILSESSKKKKGDLQISKKHEDIEERLSDLKNIIIKYIDMPQQDLNKIDLLDRLFHFQDDLNRHAKIEDQILLPLVHQL